LSMMTVASRESTSWRLRVFIVGVFGEGVMR
jgi:hypothetical protein